MLLAHLACSAQAGRLCHPKHYRLRATRYQPLAAAGITIPDRVA